MVFIYLIEDRNGLKYVGSTCKTLKRRLAIHRCDKKRDTRSCSSEKLDLDNCEISVIEECSEDVRKDREKYHINSIDCVNTNKGDFDRKSYMRQYLPKYREKNREKNREKLREYSRRYQQTYSKIPEQRAKQKAKRDYQKTWGGSPSSNNNLLLISVDLFQ